MTTGSEIQSTDYNTIRDKVVSILGPGTGQRGYGQPVTSTQVAPGNTITAAQWIALRNDLANIRVHQEGTQDSIVTLKQGDLIKFGAGNPNFNFDFIANLSITSRFNIATSRTAISTIASRSFTGVWKESATATLTVTFNSSDQARFFFNSGGKINFNTNFQKNPNAITEQNLSWENLLTAAGSFLFGGNVPGVVNFYTLTNVFQTTYLVTPADVDSIYFISGNAYKIEAKCNVSNNSTGTANVIDFKISLLDKYEDPGNSPTDNPNTDDEVDGTVTLTVEEYKAAGSLIPQGQFTITSPTYSLSTITVDS